jgi:acyl carrier protein
MDDVRARVQECFQLVFPDVPEGEIASASQATVAAWDSVAAITLVNVLEEQFEIELDLDDVADLDSFEKVCAYMQQRQKAA